MKNNVGVITSIASDWSLDLVTYPMSILIGGIGFSAALLGNWISKAGPRYKKYMII